jgi:hypothetical protein
MTPEMTYQIEEHVENAFVAYLAAGLPETVFVGPGYTSADYREPGVYVSWPESRNVSEDAPYTGHRSGMVMVTVRVHIETETDDALKTSRQQYGELRSRVIALLASEALQNELNAVISNHASIDKSILEDAERGVDAENGAYVCAIMVDVIARCVEQ